MTTLEFLQFILPVGGHYAKMALTPGGPPKQTFYNTIEELAEGIAQTAQQGDKNAYFAVSSFLTKMSRKQDNVQAVKSLFIDIDCGVDKPYGTKRDGMMALAKFVGDNGMPMPTIVDSGNGIHVYWVFTEDMPKADWQPLADAFKRSIQHNNFKVDMAVPADAARVLRPIGTVNLKGGRSVKLIKQGDPTDYAFFQKKFLGTPAAPAATAVPASIDGMAIPAHILNRTPKVTTLIQANNYPPAHPGVVAEKCLQIKFGYENQDKVDEPFWYAMLGVAAHCLDSEETAKDWSNQHSKYNEAKTLKKLAQWRAATSGPAMCAKFKELRPKGCDKCLFNGKVATPAQIGVVYDKADISADAPDKIALEVPLPEHFKRVDKRGVLGFVQTVGGTTDIDICRFDVYPMSYGRDEVLGYEVVRFKWKRPHIGWTDLVMRQAFLNAGAVREFATALADQGIVMGSARLVELFQNMLRAYMDELRALQSLTNLYNNMGWKEKNTQFLWGTTMYTRLEDGTVTSNNMSMSGTVQNSAQEMYHTEGTLAGSVAVSDVLQAQELYVHIYLIGVALSAPLMKIVGIDGMITHIYGDTGAGKSLAQHMQQSMWGDPKLLHFGAQFTQNSLYSRLGFHCNLPMTIDETTRMSPQAANDLTLMVSQGRDKARLDKNSQERMPKIWATNITTSGNIPISSLLSSLGTVLEAQLMRVLDIHMPKHRMFMGTTRPGERLYREVDTNYGWIGPAVLSYWLSMGADALRDALDQHKLDFAAKYNVQFGGAERFWETNLVLADYALKTAVHLGLLRVDPEATMTAILVQLGKQRTNVLDSRTDEFDLLSEYMNEHVRETLCVMHTANDKGVVDFNQRRETLHIRQDVFRTQAAAPFVDGTMMIDKKHFREWLIEHGGDIKSMVDAFGRAGILRPVPTNKAVLGKGFVRTPQLTVMMIDLQHPRLKGILDDADTVIDQMQMQKLQLVGKP